MTNCACRWRIPRQMYHFDTGTVSRGLSLVAERSAGQRSVEFDRLAGFEDHLAIDDNQVDAIGCLVRVLVGGPVSYTHLTLPTIYSV